MKLCFTPEEDDLLARGWPRMAKLTDGHPHDKTPARHALAWLASWREPKYEVEWPREVAHRALRLGPRYKSKSGTVPATSLNREDVALAETAGAPTAEDVRAEVISYVRGYDGGTMPRKALAWIFAAETILGADETLSALADGLAHIKSPKPRNEHAPPFATVAAEAVGFLLLRATRRNAHVARLSIELERFRTFEKKNALWAPCAGQLDASLHGAAGVRRWMGARKSTSFAEYAHDDPDYVRECAAFDPEAPMTVRLVAIAGTSVMKDVTKRRWPAAELRSVIRDFGMVRAPETVALVLSLVGKSSAKDAPMRWLEAHVDFARPFVEQAAKRGDAMAKRVVARL